MLKDTPAIVDATGVGDAIVADLQAAGQPISGFVFTGPSKLRLMQRLIAAFQNKELTIPDEPWFISELESFEFTYTSSGVKYEAPRGLHDDGVMALGLALHGWDRVQGVPPEELGVLQAKGDDPYFGRDEGKSMTSTPHKGDFSQQLPAGSW